MEQQPTPSAWIRLASDEEIAQRRPGGAPGRYEMGGVPAMGRLIQTHPRIGPRFAALLREVMVEPGALSLAERQMIAAVAAAAQDCTY